MNKYEVGTVLKVMKNAVLKRTLENEIVTVIEHKPCSSGDFYSEHNSFSVQVNSTGDEWNISKSGVYEVISTPTKSLYPKIAEWLGLEIGEEFKLKLKDEGCTLLYNYVFTNDCLTYINNSTHVTGVASSLRLQDILGGICVVVKLDWKPKVGERYYTCCPNGTIETMLNFNVNNMKREAKNIGVYKTPEEAYSRGIELGWEMLPLEK